ncbi:VWA domain-containing protein [Nocardioides sp. zg-536]|uniref:VWA domain-containing protein n=1 Tax=Nocardioides faecalis TaxID=2803858 RepID=A0A938Y7S5_9ACTN|nr:VWA domain-containing protein [Nocardioides faecalis]MBM9459420.1 VWA domain-containing protein [Nocardioides faecalis]QVI59473.1 VWA domain-containing protein [Nocardioides faecalis]
MNGLGTRDVLVALRRIGIVLAFVAVLLRPGFGQADVATQAADIDVLVVVDRTRSMAALDAADRSPRITAAKADLTALAEEVPGARFGMLAFGAEARLVLPFSTDVNAFRAAVDTLYLEGPKDGVGSRADRPVPELTEVLERVAEQRPDRRRVVVYVGDGEDTGGAAGGEDHSFADVADLVAGGVVLGYGTEQGAPMPAAADLSDADGLVDDPETNQSAISRADPDNLREIAEELDVDYVDRGDAESAEDLDRVVADLSPSYDDSERGAAQGAEHDLTWVFGLVLGALLAGELVAAWRAVWRSRRAMEPRGGRG